VPDVAFATIDNPAGARLLKYFQYFYGVNFALFDAHPIHSILTPKDGDGFVLV
jgi:hypothetical protein